MFGLGTLGQLGRNGGKFVRSSAWRMLATETQGLAIDFTDTAFLRSTGFYGSACVKDTTTAANNYNSSPTTQAASLLTYTSPSPKLTRGSSGLYRYGAHNLYLNSAAPANQSVTVVNGATYAVTLTGTVTTTLSNATTGTITAGTTTFTAGSTTLTFGSTSGAGTVHVRRTPSDSTYLATAGAIRYALPVEWSAAGVSQGILVEEQRTNLCVWASDLTKSIYVKTNATAARTATGPDGVANSASTLTASAANGVALQNIVSASAACSAQVFLKRRTGTGTVSIAVGETTGSELVTNGTFATDITGWTNTTFGAPTGPVAWNAGGSIDLPRTDGSNYSDAHQAITTVAGTLYRVSCTTGAGGINLRVGTSALGTQLATISIGASSSGSVVFVATGTTTYISLHPVANATTANVDNVSCFAVSETTVDLSSGNWVRATIENKTITNPCMAVKLATSGDAVDVAYCGVENGAFVTSPIETFSASVTRAADQISLSNMSYPYSATAGTLYVRSTPTAVGAGYASIGIGTGTPNNRIATQSHTTAHLIVTVAGVTQANIDAGTITAGATQSVALAWAANDFAVTIDGGAVGADTTGTLPAPTNLYVGWEGSGLNMTGYIKKMFYLPRRAPDVEIQIFAGS